MSRNSTSGKLGRCPDCGVNMDMIGLRHRCNGNFVGSTQHHPQLPGRKISQLGRPKPMACKRKKYLAEVEGIVKEYFAGRIEADDVAQRVLDARRKRKVLIP